MEENVKSKNRLLIQNFPKEFTGVDQSEFTKHFGAKDVCLLKSKSRKKPAVVATFETDQLAFEACKRLHQLEVLGSRLSVSFASRQVWNVDHANFDSKMKALNAKEDRNKKSLKNQDESISDKYNVNTTADVVDYISQKWDVRYNFGTELKYRYPEPSFDVLSNILNALATVPHFYVQTLHLMNKMNLPAPFGKVGEVPPMKLKQDNVADAGESRMHVQQQENNSSSEESEIEYETTDLVIGDKQSIPSFRKKFTFPKKKNVTMKVPVKRKEDSDPAGSCSKAKLARPEKVFEDFQSTGLRKGHMKFGQIASASLSKQDNSPNKVSDEIDVTRMEPNSVPTNLETSVTHSNEKMGDSRPQSSKNSSSKFISEEQLQEGKLSETEIKNLNVFKSYNPGEPNTKLYIKNLAKQTTENDLNYIFGKYSDDEHKQERKQIDIRLMKEGRMKGQCFITLEHEQKAIQAVNETNGYVLNGKPMVVQFAKKSAVSKDKS